LQAASRTDRGVHARGQVTQFLTSKIPLDLAKLKISLNQLLPKDVVVLSMDFAETSFHPTLHSKGKEYRYYLCYDSIQLPEHRFYSWHTPGCLNLETMQQAAKLLTGTHDFTSFCNVKKNAHYSHYERIIHKICIEELQRKRLCISIQGNHFLYKMVRNIVGTLIYIGRGKILLDDLPNLIQSHDRTQIGMTAPAHGLFLEKVFYE
jgi:tRNA pseudouridine38-40 synthase